MIMLILSVVVCLCVYMHKTKKNRNNVDINAADHPDAIELDNLSTQPSILSIYDEIDTYERNLMERTQPLSPYSVLTRDPYGYDELYGLNRIAILTHDPETTPSVAEQSTPGLKAMSLPTALNMNFDEEYQGFEQDTYVDLLPEKLEAHVPARPTQCETKERSKSMNDVVFVSNNECSQSN